MPVTAIRPIRERIAAELFDRLALLTAGYSAYTPVVEVIRPTRLGGFTPKHLQIVLTLGPEEIDEELSCPGNPPSVARRQTFNIRCHVLPSEKDPTIADEITTTMVADVIKVVCDESVITAPWHTMGGLAINSEWQAQETIDADGSYVGANIPLAVTYKTDEGNPYNLRT